VTLFALLVMTANMLMLSYGNGRGRFYMITAGKVCDNICGRRGMERTGIKDRAGEAPVPRKSTKDRVTWSDSAARSFKADWTQVDMGREETAIVFGAGRPSPEDGEVTVDLLGRIVLTPFMVKRLALVLRDTIHRHEALHGPLGLDPVETDPLAAPGQRPAPEKELLLGLVSGLRVEFGFERSCKVLPGIILTDRFLLSLHRDAAPREQILDVFRDLGLPDAFWAPLLQNLPDTNLVHFGFEENEKGYVYKVYLELNFKNKYYPFLLYLGFKWDPRDSARRALARYTCYPSFTPEDIIKKLSLAFHGPGAEGSVEIAQGIVDTTSRVTRSVLYVETVEEGNPRKSFDINTYAAGLRLEAYYPMLKRMADHYRIPPKRFQAFFEAMKAKRFGHLSGGTDREGRDFFTIHFGVETH